MILLHGTTRRRAEQILDLGPDPRYREPGGQGTEDGFSMYLESGPFHFGMPDEYARGKAREFPDEGGAVILVLEVPDEVVHRSATEWFPLSQGLVQFDPGAGLEELAAVWSEVARTAQIRSVT
jgi:hypothetical protein